MMNEIGKFVGQLLVLIIGTVIVVVFAGSIQSSNYEVLRTLGYFFIWVTGFVILGCWNQGLSALYLIGSVGLLWYSVS